MQNWNNFDDTQLFTRIPVELKKLTKDYKDEDKQCSAYLNYKKCFISESSIFQPHVINYVTCFCLSY